MFIVLSMSMVSASTCTNITYGDQRGLLLLLVRSSSLIIVSGKFSSGSEEDPPNKYSNRLPPLLN